MLSNKCPFRLFNQRRSAFSDEWFGKDVRAIWAAILLGAFIQMLSGCRAAKIEENALTIAEDPADLAMAKKVLQLTGTYAGNGAQKGSCAGAGCHYVTYDTVYRWSNAAQDVHFNCLQNLALTTSERIKCLRQKELGFYRSYIDSMEFKSYFLSGEEDLSENDTLHQEFVNDRLMPPGTAISKNHPRINEDDFREMRSWFLKSFGHFPGLATVFDYVEKDDFVALSQCREEVTKSLRDQVHKSSKKNWSLHLAKDQNFNMYGCSESNNKKKKNRLDSEAKSCFRDKKSDGSDRFPTLPEEDADGEKAFSFDKTLALHDHPMSSDGWSEVEHEIRVLHKFDKTLISPYALSADGGRIMYAGSTSTSTPCFKSGSVMLPLPEFFGAGIRKLYLPGSQHLGFFPNNTGVTFGGSQGNTLVCQSRLFLAAQKDHCLDPTQDADALRHCVADEMKLNGGVASDLDKPNNFLVGSHSVDKSVDASAKQFWINGQNSDPGVVRYWEPEQTVELVTLGEHQDIATSSYIRLNTLTEFTPGLGDWSISPSSQLLAARTGGPKHAARHLRTMQGYSLYLWSGDDDDLDLQKVGQICLKGSNAEMSYDDRFLVTYHVADPNDREELGLEGLSYKDYMSQHVGQQADIYLFDLCDGRKYRLTSTKPGQRALFPKFRADGWLYFVLRDGLAGNNQNDYLLVSDAAIRIAESRTCQ